MNSVNDESSEGVIAEGSSAPGVYSELPLLVQQDAELRTALIESGELFGGYHPEMEALHNSNAHKLELLLDVYGWPSLREASAVILESAWYIVMHAISLPGFQRKVLDLFAANPDLCLPKQRAMLADRVLVFSGKRQTYGTQVDWDADGVLSPYPIRDFETVDLRRHSVHLPPIQASLNALRQRAISEGDAPPPNWIEYTRKRIDWMQRVGWIKSENEIDPAYSGA